jgi:predicted RNA-binding protein with PIN domain
MKKTEYRTVNADLAAALWASGIEPMFETLDGITVEFVFPAWPEWKDAKDEPFETSDLAEQWTAGELDVDARTLSQRARQLRTQIRKTCEQFIRERRTALRKKVD